MKRKIYIALAVMLAIGSVPVYGAERHDFTAKAGTLEFYKDNVLYPLDAEIYIKDGYVMLPLRAFLTAIEGDEMHWEQADKLAWGQIGEYVVAADLENGRITVNGEEIALTGEIEVRNGRTFLPFRNWMPLLNACGYTVTEQDVLWDAETKTAKLRIWKEEEMPAEPSLLTGEGEKADFALPMTCEYDSIKNIGGGFFVAQKTKADGFDLSVDLRGEPSVYVLLDSVGQELFCIDDADIYDAEDLRNGMVLLEGRTVDRVIDHDGNIVFTSPYEIQGAFSEGLAAAEQEIEAGKKILFGYIDEAGEWVIPAVYEGAGTFSEGLAAVCVRYDYVITEADYELISEWGYIDAEGNMVIEPIYEGAAAFSEGLAAVRTEDGWGFIDQKGAVVIPPQYVWVTAFHDGMAFVMEEEGLRTWLIGRNGEKLRLVMEGERMVNLERADKIVFLPPFSGWGYHDDMTGGRYFDKNGEISPQTARIRMNLSEGLAALRDMWANELFYVDENGKQMISDTFDKAEPFHDGYAVVANETILENGEEDVEWGIIKHPARGKQ